MSLASTKYLFSILLSTNKRAGDASSLREPPTMMAMIAMDKINDTLGIFEHRTEYEF